MGKNLVIVESPAKCKTISKYLSKDFTVEATMGHIIDLPVKELGVDIEHEFTPKYIVAKGKKRVLSKLKKAAKEADMVYLAPDPDREGEAIAYHVYNNIDKKNGNVKRVSFNEITKRAVTHAIEHPQEIDMNRVAAQQARRILDRIVGYQISPVLWKIIFRGLSAGRVQSVALRLVCEREEAIQAFVPQEYWTVRSRHGHNDTIFEAGLHFIDGKKAQIPDEAHADAILRDVRGADFVVKEVVREQKKRRPYAPFITSTLQQDAARRLGFSASKTMMVAQQLYEGIELGDQGFTGLITYMRTDSIRVATEAVMSAREFITARFGEAYIPEKPRMYSSKKGAQDAHEAIRPVYPSHEYTPERVASFLSKDQQRLYTLIWQRFMASQASDALYDNTRIDMRAAERYIFRATGSILTFDGFLAIYDIRSDDKEGASGNDTLPALAQGDAVSLEAVDKKQHFTQPPPRFSEASLVKELEQQGIGRPSTYSQIIDTLKKRQYVSMENKRFAPTELGTIVTHILVNEFSDIFEVGFTAEMEEKLDRIESGVAREKDTLQEFYEAFSKELERTRGKVKELKQQYQEKTDRMCPTCGEHHLVVKWGKNGKFLACEGFPACRHTEPLEQEKQMSDETCDKCGAPMAIITHRNGRFLGCSRYPECKNTRPITTGVHCPEENCSGELTERRSKRGKIFYSCSRYPDCTFAMWDLPKTRTCDKCGFTVMGYKETKSQGAYYRCPACKARQKVDTDTRGDSD
jgi:DNA topoisomerase-1